MEQADADSILVKSKPVDERTAKWEVGFPDYRVIFFGTPTGPAGRTPDHSPGMTDCRDLSGVHNVHQALAWADANAQGRRYILYVKGEDSARGLGLLQLTGDDPNRPGDPHRNPPADLPG